MKIDGANELKADIKGVLYQRQFHFVIIEEGQIFKRRYQDYLSKLYLMIMGQFKCLNDFIKFGDTSPRDKGASNFEVISLKLPHF